MASNESPTSPRTVSRHPLENPVYESLSGPHHHFVDQRGSVVRYPADVSPFGAFADVPTDDDWSDLATLVGPGGVVVITGITAPPPDGWETLANINGVQMVDDHLAAAPLDEAVLLTESDVPDMLELVQRTRPGPFATRTIELGTYLGIRRDGTLIAMAGERMHPPGWVEISAVCTDDAYRGLGLATRLIHAIAYGIRERGETPFLHASATNVNAVRLYEALGFRLSREVNFSALRVPGTPSTLER
jgi:ribosomal protein S18 acetylase RimI-like enzyme